MRKSITIRDCIGLVEFKTHRTSLSDHGVEVGCHTFVTVSVPDYSLTRPGFLYWYSSLHCSSSFG
jgi:hypothetical protein